MKLPVKVLYKNGTEEVFVAEFEDFIGFERAWHRSVRVFENEMRLTDIAWLAWSASQRAKKHGLKFDPDWIGTVEFTQIVDEPEEEAASDNPLPDTKKSKPPQSG